MGPLLKKSDYIEITIREQRIRLYIIQGVSEDTQFMPRTRKEISVIRLLHDVVALHVCNNAFFILFFIANLLGQTG